MSDTSRAPWWMGPASLAGAGFIRTLGATWRIEASGFETWVDGPMRGGRCIFALWHARLLPLAYTHRGRGVVLLVSRHRDGEIIARVIQRLGYLTVRGSSTRGGEASLRAMVALAPGHSLGITPDGPRGPREQLKPGVVALASLTGLPVVPVAAADSGAWVLRSWDGFRVPRPFARIVVAHGEPIHVPPSLSAAETEGWRLRVESALHEHTRLVRERAGEAA
jgi:hypothetical protein